MAQNAIQNLMGNRDAIRKLMAMDANGQLDRIAEGARANGSLVGGEEGATYNMPETQPKAHQNIVVNEQVMAKHARMPRAVLESFQNNPIQDAPLPSGMGGSVLDGINIPVQKNPNRQNVVTEQAQPVQYQQQISAPVDYSLLKTIINEAVQENVKKYMSALSKKLMTEGVGNNSGNNVQAIKIGDKFSFITENGDVYTCTMQKKYNIHEQMQK